MTGMNATTKIVLVTFLLLISTSIVSAQQLRFTSSNGDAIWTLDYRMANKILGDDTWGYDYNFSFNDGCAYSWTKFLGEIYNSHKGTWKWYSPDAKIYSINSYVQDAPIDGYYETINAWCCLPIRGRIPTSLAGKWRVDFYLDSQFAFTEDFYIV